MLDLYEFKMALFENGDPEEFLLFVRNFQMTLKASGTLTASAKIQYIHTLLRGEALHQLDTLPVEVGIMIKTNLNHIILGLGTYFFPINALSKQKRAMHHGMSKPCKLKVRLYDACLIYLNYNLGVFPGAKANDKVGET